MTARPQLGCLLAVVLVAACTDGGLERDHAAPSPREVLAQVLRMQLPPTAGTDPLADGPSVWVTPTEIAVEFTDRGLVRHIPVEKPERGDLIVSDLYDAIAPLMTDHANAPAVNVLVDHRVTLLTTLIALNTLSRAGAHDFRLVGGTPAKPGALAIEPSPFCALDDPARPPVTDIQADLALRWSADGLRAWALPRPAGRKPFGVGFYELAPPDDPDEPDDPTPAAPTFPDEVPLQLDAGDPPLDLAAVQRLSAQLCAFNHGPFGVVLSALETTTHGELLAVLDAANPAAGCRGPRRIDGWLVDPRTGPAITIAALRAHVLALANATPQPGQDTPP